MNDHEVIAQFRAAMEARAIQPPDQIITDGQLHRCDAQGKRGKKDSVYLYQLA